MTSACLAAAHRRRTAFVVAPLMIFEVGSAVAPTLRPPVGEALLVWLGLGLLATIWVSTALSQFPLHARLAAGYSTTTHRRLVGSNWLRTAAWSARALIAFLPATLASGS